MDLVDPGCGSGLETLARLHLRRRHIRVRSQVHIPPVGWVDLLIGGRLVLELDSRPDTAVATCIPEGSARGHKAELHSAGLSRVLTLVGRNFRRRFGLSASRRLIRRNI